MVDRSMLTSAGVTEGSIERGAPLKGASDGGGGMMEDPSLALRDCLRLEILIEEKLEKLSQSFRFSSSEVKRRLSDECSSSLTSAQRDLESVQELMCWLLWPRRAWLMILLAVRH